MASAYVVRSGRWFLSMLVDKCLNTRKWMKSNAEVNKDSTDFLSPSVSALRACGYYWDQILSGIVDYPFNRWDVFCYSRRANGKTRA